MRLIIFILLTLAYNGVTAKLQQDVSFEGRRINDFHDYIYRNKRDINISKKSDSLTINAIKDIFNDENKKISVIGNVNGLKEARYDNIEAGLSFADRFGNKLSGKGNINILNTDKHVLKADGFVVKEFPSKSDHDVYKYGGTLDYINKNKFKGQLTAQHDSSIGDKLVADATYNIFNTKNKDLSTRGFWGRSISLDGRTYDNFGGSLDYSNGNKFKGQFLAQHDSNFGDKLSAHAKYNILNTENQDLSARGFWGRSVPLNRSPIDSYGGILDYSNRNGNTATLAVESKPNFGTEIAASGKYNILHNDDHNLAVSLGLSRTIPSNPGLDNYNSYYGNLDYNYKDKFGANLGIKHYGASDRTDVSLLGRLDLLPKSVGNLDVFARASKSGDQSSFKPTFGITFSKDF